MRRCIEKAQHSALYIVSLPQGLDAAASVLSVKP